MISTLAFLFKCNDFHLNRTMLSVLFNDLVDDYVEAECEFERCD